MGLALEWTFTNIFIMGSLVIKNAMSTIGSCHRSSHGKHWFENYSWVYIWTCETRIWGPRARSHLHSVGPRPSHASTVCSSCPHLFENFSPMGSNVATPSHLSHEAPLACEGTPSIDLGIMKVVSAWVFANLSGYCHIGSQHGKIPTQMRAWRLGSEGGVGGAAPILMKMWSSLERYEVIGPAPTWELLPIGNQCDNTRSLKPLSSFGMWIEPHQSTWE